LARAARFTMIRQLACPRCGTADIRVIPTHPVDSKVSCPNRSDARRLRPLGICKEIVVPPARKPLTTATKKAPAPVKAVKKAGPAAIKAAAPAKKPAPAKAAPQVTITLKQIAAVLTEGHDLPKKQAEDILGDLVALATQHLKRGYKLRLTGLGILQVRSRPARMGRNPATGESIKIAASKKIAFRPAKELTEAM
jgi:DNA-binding protein HU-beta